MQVYWRGESPRYLFFKVTTSRSRAVDNGPCGIPISCSVLPSASRFNLWKLTRLSGVFPPFVGHFFKREQEHEVKLRHIVYEVWLVSYLLFSFQIWYFRKWIITSMGQSKHMRVTRFKPLWVSSFTDSTVFMLFFFSKSRKSTCV